MDLYDIKQTYKTLVTQFNELSRHLNIEELNEDIKKYDQKMVSDGFWDDQRQAKVVIDKRNNLKDKVTAYDAIIAKIEDVDVGFELYEETQEPMMLEEVESLVTDFKQLVTEFETELLLSGEYDRKNVILELHPGAGGTESQDWGSMLMRMYMRYAEQKGFKVEVVDYLAGDEAGIKSVTLHIKGPNAFGYLKSEKGVHRLVRISPFDSSGRRHTSFVSVDVMPELDDDIEVEINQEDLKIDTYRSSGAGGQHVNTTDSAVRITHLPTGIVVSCQAERSQIQNRERAMTMLKMKLHQLYEEQQQQALDSIRGEQKEIGWGSQIRSYVFHPYSMVKDHRTNVEVGNVQAVMDGDLDQFVMEYLRSNINIDQ